MKLIVIRHGDPDYERDTLTEKGIREAQALAERVNQWDVKEFYCSPLGRAKATAAFSLEKLGRTAKQLDWLQEFYVRVQDPITGQDRIPWDLMPSYWTQQPFLYDKDRWIEAPIMQTGNITRQWETVKAGLDEMLHMHGYQREGAYYRVEDRNRDTIVCFCHLGVSCVIAAHLLGVAPPVLWQGFYLAPTSVTIFQTEEREDGIASFRCRVFGDTSHLLIKEEPISESGAFSEIFQQENRHRHKKKNWL